MRDQRVHDQADSSCCNHDDRFREFFEAPQDSCGGNGQRSSDPVGNGALADDDHRPCDGADPGGRNALHEGDNVRALAVFLEVRRRDNREQVARHEGKLHRAGLFRAPLAAVHV